MKYSINFDTWRSPGFQNATLLIFFSLQRPHSCSVACTSSFSFPQSLYNWHALGFSPWTSPLFCLHLFPWWYHPAHGFGTWLLSNPSPAQTSVSPKLQIHTSNYSTILSEYPVSLICKKYLIISNILLQHAPSWILDLPYLYLHHPQPSSTQLTSTISLQLVS